MTPLRHPSTRARLEAYDGDPADMPAPLLELVSAHACAESFGAVLEWATLRTDELFAPPKATAAELFAEAMGRAAAAYTRRDARRVERAFTRDAA